MSELDNLSLGLRYHRQLKKLCTPIQQAFGFTDIAYVEIVNGRYAVNMHSHEKWLSHCFDKGYYMHDPTMVSPDQIASGFSFSFSYPEKEYVNTLVYDAVEFFGMGDALSYIEKNGNGYCVLTFETTAGNTAFQSKVAENMGLLQAFIPYFRHKAAPWIHALSESPCDLATLKGEAFYTQPGVISNIENKQENRIAFARKIGLIPEAIFSLSREENSCLRGYLSGLSPNDLAKHLNLPNPTVRSHLNRVKDKLGVATRAELFDSLLPAKELNVF